eukprot:214828-Amphidinium_carterae.1
MDLRESLIGGLKPHREMYLCRTRDGLIECITQVAAGKEARGVEVNALVYRSLSLGTFLHWVARPRHS